MRLGRILIRLQHENTPDPDRSIYDEDMEMQALRVFLTVAEELHFSRAAKRLHLAQPPVSRTIRALEQELGVDLFQRTTRSVTLTAAGNALVGPARRILREAEQASRTVGEARQGALGRIAIAFAGVSTHALVGKLARAVRVRYPGITLELSSQNFAQPAMSQVLNGEADISFGRWDFVPTGVDAQTLVEEHLVVAVPAQHDLAKHGEIRMADLATEGFVTLPSHPGSVLSDRLLRLCHNASFDPYVVQIAPDTWTALSLVAAEVGCLLTVSSVAQNTQLEEVVFLRVLDDFQSVQLRIAWRRDTQNPALRIILDLAREILL